MSDTDFLDAIMGDNPEVPEYVFREYFVDILFNMDSKEKRDIWVEKATGGNPFIRVNVIDEQGGVLFWVPPIEQKPVLNTHNRNMGEVLREVELRRRANPIKGEVYANYHLKGFVGKASMTDEDRAQWKMIHDKYVLNKNKLTGSDNRPNNLPDSNDEYEEW